MSREVKLYIRIFPVLDRDWESFRTDDKVIYIKFHKNKQGATTQDKFWQYKTDGIFTNQPQEIIYRDLTNGMFERIFDGIELLFLAYGQSGTGKTYTVSGIDGKYEFRGLVPRFISELFYYRQYQICHKKMTFSMSHCEVIGKSVYDLITHTPTLVPSHKEPTKVPINSEALALRLIFEGERKRRHEKEKTHCGSGVLVLYINTESLVHSDPRITSSKVYFVDMAGVETVWRRETKSFTCQKDANLQKSAIEHMATWAKSLISKDYLKPNHRNSRLLNLLGSSLKNGFVRLIGHVLPSRENSTLTLSTLKFGLKVKGVPSPPLVLAAKPNPLLIQENLKKELAELKDQVMAAELLKGSYYPINMTQGHLEHLQRLGRAYFSGVVNELVALTAFESVVLLPILKEMYQQQKAENEIALEGAMEATKNLFTSENRDSLRSKKSKTSKASRVSSVTTDTPVAKTKSHGKKTDKPVMVKSAVLDSISLKLTETESFVSKSLDVPTRDTLWSEFMKRYPHYKVALDTLQEEHDNALREKEKLTSNILGIKEQFDWNKARLDNATWERRVNFGNKCDSAGQLIMSDAEISLKKTVDDLEEAYRNEKMAVQYTQDRYVAVLNSLIELRHKIEQEFQDYSSKIYATSVVIPPLITETEIKIPHPTCEEKKGEAGMRESETFFTHLQQSHWKRKGSHEALGVK